MWPLCPLASRGVWPVGTPEEMEAIGFNLRLPWAGRVPQAQLLSCHPSSGLGVGTCGRNGVTSWPGLPETVPGNPCWHSHPVSRETPWSGQSRDSWSPEGEKPSLVLSPALCPHLGVLSFCYGFSEIHHFVSAICFFPGPWLTHQELQKDGLASRALPSRAHSNQWAGLETRGDEVHLLGTDSFRKIRHLRGMVAFMMVAVGPYLPVGCGPVVRGGTTVSNRCDSLARTFQDEEAAAE